MACLFCGFISGKIKHHLDGLPFLPVFENKKIVIFLTDTHNEDKTHHLLVAPKKHIKSIEDVKKDMVAELVKYSLIASKILKRRYGGSHIVLNNGWHADQYIPHIHFHVIPKTSERKNPWESQNKKDFEKLSLKLRKDFSKFS